MFGLKRKEVTVEVDEPVVAVAEVPVSPPVVADPFPDKPVRSSLAPELSEGDFAEYSRVAQEVGINIPALLIERFKLFLVKHDIPVYDLKTVVAYMDALAKRDNSTGFGWSWKPLRGVDTERHLRFGTPSSDGMPGGLMFFGDPTRPRMLVPASDYFETVHYGGGSSWPVPPYSKVVPLHALKRVALVDKEFGKGTVLFAVSDYQTEPHIRPDPFLMAIIPNDALADGVGRFVIDVWDEPGFGIDKMLA